MSPAMNDIFERRRALVLDLITQRFDNNKASFAKRIERSPSQVGHFTYPPGHLHHKDIGEDLARHIEDRCGLPPGVLVNAPAVTLAEALTATVISGIKAFAEPVHGRLSNVYTQPGDRDLVLARAYATVATSDPKAYLVEVTDNSNAPRLMLGEFVLVEPLAPVELEDDVVVMFNDGDNMICRLVSRRNGIHVSTYNGGIVKTLPTGEVQAVHAITLRIHPRLVTRKK